MPAKVMDKCAAEAGGTAHGLPYVDEMYNGDQRFLVGKNVVFEDVTGKERNGLMKNSCTHNDSCSDNESSSIGKNSDLSENSLEKSRDGEEEVQSSYKNPFDAIGDLEDVLPIRKGMSRFYNGKSKSFTSLAEASSSSSIKDLAKPENAFRKKRRNPLSYRNTWGKTRSSPLSLKSNGVGISKRMSNLSGTSLGLAVAMNYSQGDKQCDSSAGSFPPSMKDSCHWRSFSVADLQHCVSAATTSSNPNQFDTRLS